MQTSIVVHWLTPDATAELADEQHGADVQRHVRHQERPVRVDAEHLLDESYTSTGTVIQWPSCGLNKKSPRPCVRASPGG